MSKMITLLAGAAGLATIATATPAAAQYYSGYSPYGYATNSYAAPSYAYGANAYGNRYAYGNQAYGYGANTAVAQQQCTAAVQRRLYNRSSIGGIIGALLGANTTGTVVG